MSIAIEFPDGSKKEFDDGVLVLDVAKSISTSLGKKAVAGKFNGELVDLQRPLKQDGKLQILTATDDDALIVLNDTAAFLLAATLKEVYPKMHFGEGHSTADGFFYDTDNEDGQVTVNDLEDIKAKMAALVKANGEIKRVFVSKDDLLKIINSLDNSKRYIFPYQGRGGESYYYMTNKCYSEKEIKVDGKVVIICEL